MVDKQNNKNRVIRKKKIHRVKKLRPASIPVIADGTGEEKAKNKMITMMIL